MTDLTAGIRRAAAPERAKGAAVPSTAGSNGGDPVLQAPTPARTVGGNAAAFPKVDAAHKSMAWHELTDVEHRAYTETMVVTDLHAGEILTLDPTRVQVWRVEVLGAGTTIVIPTAPEFPSPANARLDAPERRRVWSCVLIVRVLTAGQFPVISGASWSERNAFPDISNPDGTDPTDDSGVYVFTFLGDSYSGRVYGFEGGLRF